MSGYVDPGNHDHLRIVVVAAYGPTVTHDVWAPALLDDLAEQLVGQQVHTPAGAMGTIVSCQRNGLVLEASVQLSQFSIGLLFDQVTERRDAGDVLKEVLS